MFERMVFGNAVKWQGGRKGMLSTRNDGRLEVSTPPEFSGVEGYWSPEKLFLASINSCLMTTFLYFAEKLSVPFVGYESGIEGEVNLRQGRLLFTRITVRPHVRVSEKSQEQTVAEVVKKSGKYCLVSASVATEIQVRPTITAEPSHAASRADTNDG